MKRYLLLALPLALAACSKPPQPETSAPPAPIDLATPSDTTTSALTLSTHHWRLVDAKDAQGKRIAALFVRQDKPLQLDFNDGKVGVSNACNRIGGTYTIEGQRLTIEPMMSTQMACSDRQLMALDQEATQRLEGSSTLVQSGDTLTLTTASGDVLSFKGEHTADARYGGPGEIAFLEVAAQTKACNHPLIPNMQCLQVREIKYDAQGIKTGTDSSFENFYEGIEGYTHEPGVRNVLRVKRYKRDPVPADASSTAYVLDMVVESETAKP